MYTMSNKKDVLNAIAKYENQDLDENNNERLYVAYKRLADTTQGECCCGTLGALCCCGL